MIHATKFTLHLANSADWFLQAGVAAVGKVSMIPAGSPAMIERLSVDGETIVILPSNMILECGLILKKRQSLIGISKSGLKPVITKRKDFIVTE